MTPFASTFERSLVAKSDSTEIRGGWGAGESAGFALVRGSGHADDQVPRGGHVHAVRARRRRRRGRARRRLVPAAGTALGVVHDGWYLSRYSLNSRFFATNSREHLRLSLSLSLSLSLPLESFQSLLELGRNDLESVFLLEKKNHRDTFREFVSSREMGSSSRQSRARAHPLYARLFSRNVLPKAFCRQGVPYIYIQPFERRLFAGRGGGAGVLERSGPGGLGA